MTEINAELVRDLRARTGAGMMDCKRALVETGGDLDAAEKLLREKGMADAAKRADRATTEGVVLTRIENGRGAIVAVACETEPVSKNEEFATFAERVLDAVDADGPEAAQALDGERIELVAKLGENIEIRDAARLEATNGETLADYVHPPARKLGVLVRAKASPELARMLAMHIAASPGTAYVARDEVPAETIEAERAIYEKLPEVEGKPDDIRAKIVDGMLAKRLFADIVLVDQPWVHDSSLTVGKALAEHGAEVREFVRQSVA